VCSDNIVADVVSLQLKEGKLKMYPRLLDLNTLPVLCSGH